jgi:hypothetical protein
MLVVCTHCQRHARNDAPCFFCGAALAVHAQSAPRGRVSRAVALAAAAATVGLACGARTDLGGERSESANDAASAPDCRPAMTVYGGPFFDAGCKLVPPPPDDASTLDVLAGDASSADVSTDVVIAPPYGSHAPPNDPDE